MMTIRFKQGLCNIWSSIYEKLKQHWGWPEKSVAYKKKRVCYRRSRSNGFYKKELLKNVTKFTGKTYIGVSFVIKLQISGQQHYLKREPDAGVFLWILRYLSEHLFMKHLRWVHLKLLLVGIRKWEWCVLTLVVTVTLVLCWKEKVDWQRNGKKPYY